MTISIIGAATSYDPATGFSVGPSDSVNLSPGQKIAMHGRWWQDHGALNIPMVAPLATGGVINWGSESVLANTLGNGVHSTLIVGDVVTGADGVQLSGVWSVARAFKAIDWIVLDSTAGFNSVSEKSQPGTGNSVTVADIDTAGPAALVAFVAANDISAGPITPSPGWDYVSKPFSRTDMATRIETASVTDQEFASIYNNSNDHYARVLTFAENVVNGNKAIKINMLINP